MNSRERALVSIPAGEIPGRIRSGELRARDLAEAVAARIERLDPELGAFLATTPQQARQEADRVDEGVENGKSPGPLAGIPVAIKDNIVTAGVPTTAGSRILEGHVPVYEATVVERLRRAGAVLVGKTNLDEFGMGSSTENSGFRSTRNPWNPDRVSGGSSGGSAAAVAARMAGLALGSDTGGSVRQPAALCGVYGLKPTYGRVSRYGLIAFASSLDQIGGFSRDLPGLALLYQAISGHDERDSTSADRAVEPVPGDGLSRGDGLWPGDGALSESGSGASLRVGFAESFLAHEGVQPEVAEITRKAGRILSSAGLEVQDIELPDPEIGIASYYLLATAEASSNLARYDGVRYGNRASGEGLEGMYRATRSRGFGAEVKRRIMLGTYVLSSGYYDAYYLRAQKVRADLRHRFQRLFESVDVILLPTSPTSAFPLGERVDDPMQMYLADVFTVFANLTGIPGISIPMGLDDGGLPVAVQVLAPAWREDNLFAVAGVIADAVQLPAWPDPGEEVR